MYDSAGDTSKDCEEKNLLLNYIIKHKSLEKCSGNVYVCSAIFHGNRDSISILV